MYHHIRGTLTHATPATAVIEAGGIGYELLISLNTHRMLKSVGTECRLYCHLAVREDAHALYGFAEESERDMFRSLISVTGIGPATAVQILSGTTPEKLARAIEMEDTTALRQIKGIGPKTAQRIILDLKGTASLSRVMDAPMPGQPPRPAGDLATTAARALESLGIPAKEAAQRVAKVMEKNPGISLEDCIRSALQ